MRSMVTWHESAWVDAGEAGDVECMEERRLWQGDGREVRMAFCSTMDQ